MYVRRAPSRGCGDARAVNSRERGRWILEHSERRTDTAHRRTDGMASSQGKSELRYADWMSSLPETLHSIPLTNLAIPGKSCYAF